jgi:hypothetical protein
VRINGEAIVTERIYRAAVEALSRKGVKVWRVMGMVLATLGVLVLGGSVPMGSYLLVAAVVVGVLLPWSLVSITVRRVRPALVGPWRYEFTDDGLRMATPLGLCDMAWPNLPGHTNHRDFWLVQTPIKGQSLIVVKAAFSAEDQQAIAHELHRRHIEPRAGTHPV